MTIFLWKPYVWFVDFFFQSKHFSHAVSNYESKIKIERKMQEATPLQEV